jgi:predicted SprT family Zn-dependent metalloprotease
VNTRQLHDLADALLAEHSLQDWTFRVDYARNRLGSCHYAKREITVSRHFASHNDTDAIRETLLHEIAHALAGAGEGHGPKWQREARRLGIRARATNSSAVMPPPKWSLQCTHCQQVVARRHRRVLDLSRTRCAQCGIAKGELRWVSASQTQ